MTEQQALLLGMGRFPVAGAARFSDDWWNPRRHADLPPPQGVRHLRRPSARRSGPRCDGTAKITNGPTGGLAVYVTMPDRTYFYLAHLSAVADGLRNGQKVTTGQVVGFVGDSGNAAVAAAHLHLEIHPRGGGPTHPSRTSTSSSPRHWVRRQRWSTASGAAYEQRQAATTPTTAPVAKAVTPAVRPPLPSPVLWASSMTPAGAPLQVAEVEVAAAAAGIDWDRLARRDRATTALWEQAELAADAMVRPLIAPSLAPHPRLAITADLHGARSVAEVVELQWDAEVLALERLDGGLQIVPLLALHPDLVALRL